MSYHTWTVDGYGICTDELEADVTLKGLQNLINLAPKYRKKVEKIFKDENIQNPKFVDYMNILPWDFGCGIAEIMANVIDETEDVRLECCSNFNGENYLLFVPVYPWARMTKGEKNVKAPEDIKRIINRYCKILSGKSVSLDYYAVENGG